MVVTGTSVDVEAFVELYIEPALESIRLEVDRFGKSGRNRLLPGDGRAGFLSKSLSFGMPIVFGLENSFIFDRCGLIVFSGNGGAGGGTGGGPIGCSCEYPV